MRTFIPAILAFTTAVAIAAQLPRPAPELAFRLPNGQQQLISNYRGRVVALEFLLTGCPHCQRSSQVLEKLYREYASRGFQPLGVAINSDAAAAVPGFIQRFGLTHPVGIGDNAAAKNYVQVPPGQRLMMPQLLIIDRKGVIQAQWDGENPMLNNGTEEATLRPLIEKLLKEPAVARKSRITRK
jgi:peroxiredoxin